MYTFCTRFVLNLQNKNKISTHISHFFNISYYPYAKSQTASTFTLDLLLNAVPVGYRPSQKQWVAFSDIRVDAKKSRLIQFSSRFSPCTRSTTTHTPCIVVVSVIGKGRGEEIIKLILTPYQWKQSTT